ncbi:hypothetical protein GCM10008023_27030 [Sphingomonas glacialis]|uniref:HlyD family efflux transporter periplasmic adaptor subunit n=1 Tax=Sphingomonas glacialis TaxID=658225 RepID=A0ABQ3LNU3_9SPHN|nr:hypothetical protein [Sphingomonas glacialis]GHH19832.1 hypothetical protein GCM10008023_27030 [Sphingomonas glacialis]
MTMPPRLRLILAAVVITVLIGIAFWAVGEVRVEAGREAERERPVATPQRVFTENGQRIVKLDVATMARSGIVGTRVEASDTAGTSVPTFASIVDTARLTDLASAWAVGQAQTEAARARAEASRASYERTRLLYADAQNASLAQVQAAQAAYAADRAGVSAAEAQANTSRASARQEFGPNLGLGSALVRALIERRALLLQAALPPAAASAPSTLSVEGDGVRANARLLGPAARADPRVPGRGVYYVVDGSSGLVPGMNVTVQLPVAGGRGGVAIPASAVVSWQGKSWVYLRKADGAFLRTEIATGQHDAGGNIRVDSIVVGSFVVTQGAQLLLSEELRSDAPAESDGD